MVKQNKYLLQLLDEIERLRKNSINNVKKTDLYTKEDISKIIDWYDQLLYVCKAQPPTSWVNSVKIQENSSGCVTLDGYEYSTNRTSISVVLIE